MRGMNNQVWVTSVTSENDVQAALVLCSSLREVHSSRMIAVLVAPMVAKELREALYLKFDLVFDLDMHQNKANLAIDDFAKLYALLALASFEKCVYVSPSSLVLQNCDEIFNTCHDGDFVLPKDAKNLSIFLFRPSWRNFNTIMIGLIAAECADIGSYIEFWLGNQNSGDNVFLNSKFSNNIIPGAYLNIAEENIGIVHFPTATFLNENYQALETNHGILGKMIGNYWQKLFDAHVKPLLAYYSNCKLFLPKTLKQQEKEPIAIVGMSVRLPGSNNLNEFWDLLVNGKDGTSTPPTTRWGSTNESSSYNAGFLKTPIDEADARFFGLSPKDVLCMDPQHRLLLELVWEALEDSGINPFTLHNTPTSIYVGSWLNQYKEFLTGSNDPGFYRKHMGNALSAAAARISHFLGLTGPSIGVESACSSSMVAVHMACRSLIMGETNISLACGVNLLVNPYDKDAWSMIVSSDGHCKTFSENADGYGKAEGCAVLVLKRYSDAVRDEDRIWALIKGSAIAQEGLSTSMGTPTVHTEEHVMKDALAVAGVLPENVSFVEAHGTGTAVGDPMEVAAIARAYGTSARKEPLIIGTVKTNIGHTESCSGIAGMVKVVLSMHNEIIPAHLNFTKLNPAINLEAIPAIIPLTAKLWKRKNGVRRIAGVSSFGITGTDAHVIIEEAPNAIDTKPLKMDTSILTERAWQILKLSTRSEISLNNLMSQYCEHIKTSATSEIIEDITFSANTGRTDFSQRAFVLGRDKTEIVSNLQRGKYLSGTTKEDNTQGKICFLFTGQGCQYPGMAKNLYETSPVFRIHFDYCDKLLKERFGLDIKTALWASQVTNAIINRTLYSQTSIFCVEYALLKLWQSWGVQPDFVLGHSLGEFCAAVCAEYISLNDALTLVVERSLLIDSLPEGKMLVIRAEQKQVAEQLKIFSSLDPNKILEIAAVNSAEQTVVAGDSDLVFEFSEFLKKQGTICTVLSSKHAFHSRHMDPMLKEYRLVAKKISCNASERTNTLYISGMLAKLIEDKAELCAEYWVRHTRDRVNFSGATQEAVKLGCRIFIEIGPQPVLSALTMSNCYRLTKDITILPSIKRGEDEWKTMLTTLGKIYLEGVPISWKGIDMYRNRKRVSLPHYPFERKVFWPEIPKNMTKSEYIHPLLGSPFHIATPTKLFQNCGLILASVEYMKDHRIGETIIFPGTGYLEMCLAAARSIFESRLKTSDSKKLVNALVVENLRIEAPLKLQDSHDTTLQTLLEPAENVNHWNTFSIRIFNKTDEIKNQWLLHAQGKIVSECCTAYEKFSQTLSSANFLSVIDSDKDANAELSTNLYEGMSKLGLIFGPNFRSLEKCWQLSDSNIIAKIKYPDTQFHDYVVHPIILDAMLQTFVVLKFQHDLNKKICVPIKIGRFVLLADMRSFAGENLYVQVIQKNAEIKKENFDLDGCVAYLLDSKCNLLGIMENIELVDTTAKAIESVIRNQVHKNSDIWEEIWRPCPGPCQALVDLSKLKLSMPVCDTIQPILHSKCNSNPVLSDTLNQLNKLVYWCILRAFYQSGWVPSKVGTVIETEKLFSELRFETRFRKQFGYFLSILEEEGILAKSTNNSLKFVAEPPAQSEVECYLNTATSNQKLVQTFPSTLLVTKIGDNLAEILNGVQPVLNILFPSENSSICSNLEYTPSAKCLYKEYGTLSKFTDMADIVLNGWLKKYKEANTTDSKQIFRILEIGAGTGNFTNEVLKAFAQNGIDFNYCYTDISSAFFESAKTRFEKYNDSMAFKRLNIEDDPLSQDFIPEYFDLVVAGDVVHATKDLKETLYNINLLLKPGGFFHLYETVKVSRIITFIFGLLDGFWRFEDVNLRTDHCTLPQNKWVNLLEQCGFSEATCYPYGNYYHALISTVKTSNIPHPKLETQTISTVTFKKWVVFHHESCDLSTYLTDKLASYGRDVVVVTRGNKLENLSSMSDSAMRFTINPKSEQDFQDVFRHLNTFNYNNKTLLEGVLYCWSLDTHLKHQEDILQPYFHMIKVLASLKQNPLPTISVLTSGAIACETSNFWHPYSSTLVGFTRSINNEIAELPCRIIEIGQADMDTKEQLYPSIMFELWSGAGPHTAFWDGCRYIRKLQPCTQKPLNLDLPPASSRFKLLLPESKSIADLEFGPLEEFELGPEEIEAKVMATALNFQDVFVVLKPIDYFKNAKRLGLDFAGIITKIGSRVTKWKIGDCVFGPNVTNLALPSHVKQLEYNILPMPHDMTFQEACTIPIVASTSVHCLLEIAKITDVDTVLIHTASGGVGLSAIQICNHIGAKIICTAGSKRKRSFLKNLGVHHVFNSRDTLYEKAIFDITDGKGVSVVLNSLTSEGFKEATLRTCSQGARFIEMSKLSIWTQEEIAMLRPDIKYTVVDIAGFTPAECNRTLTKVKTLLEKGVLQPLPYIRFNATNIQDALFYLQKAKHIGKVICVMPSIKRQGTRETNTYTPLFNDRSSYLITGGFGGIGLEVGKWMVEMGAKHVVLAGRRLPTNAIANKIAEFNEKAEANIKITQLDVGDYNQCYDLIHNKICKQWALPPLRGVMHAAGTLHDSFVANHTWKTLSSTFQAKIDGSENLDKVTSSLLLEHFVTFSSIVSVLGTSGQSNHAASNYFEDAMAFRRVFSGKCALTVNWGQWSEVGVAVDKDIPGFRAMSTQEALSALEHSLLSQRTQVMVMNLESVALASKMHPQLPDIIDERYAGLGNEKQTSPRKFVADTDEFWSDYNATESISEKSNIIRNRVNNILKNILKWDEGDQLNEHEMFQNMGVDSLMFVEMKNELQVLFGSKIHLSANLVRDFNTVELLANQLVAVIQGDADIMVSNDPNILLSDDLQKLIASDCLLDTDIQSKIGQHMSSLKDIKYVLVTGCTGNFGPYVIKELSQREQILEIYCLVRQSPNDNAYKRLDTVFEKRGLHTHVDMKKIKYVTGNVVARNLGMSSENWIELGNKIDAVFHLAASVQHMEVYKKQETKCNENLSDMRSVNVEGLKNTLRFCVTGNKLKHVYISSSLVAIANGDPVTGALNENWPHDTDFDNLTNLAYPVSKFVGDVLMKQAVLERGIPGKVFRFPMISGDSKTGNFVLEHNHFMLRYVFILQTGIIPSKPVPVPMLPVDVCARVSLGLFFNEDAKHDVYNITNQCPDMDQEFVKVAKRLGYEVRMAEFSEFREKLMNAKVEDTEFALFKDFYNGDADSVLFNMAPLFRHWQQEGLQNALYFKSKKLDVLLPEFYQDVGSKPTMEFVYQDLLYAKSQGWLP